MRWLYLVEVLGSLVPSVTFGILFGRPWRKHERRTAWMVASWVWAAVAFESTLLLGLLGFRIPGTLAAVVLAGPLAVSWWRLSAFVQDRSPLVRSAPRPEE